MKAKIHAVILFLLMLYPGGIRASVRLVQLAEPCLAAAVAAGDIEVPALTDGGPDLSSPAAVDYLAGLAGVQSDFEARLADVCPGARVRWRYQLLVNALAVEGCAAERLAAVPGAYRVHGTLDFAQSLDSITATTRVGDFWERFDSPDPAGHGVHVALMENIRS